MLQRYKNKLTQCQNIFYNARIISIASINVPISSKKTIQKKAPKIN